MLQLLVKYLGIFSFPAPHLSQVSVDIMRPLLIYSYQA